MPLCLAHAGLVPMKLRSPPLRNQENQEAYLIRGGGGRASRDYLCRCIDFKQILAHIHVLATLKLFFASGV